jgi:hypothetical protein
MLLLELSSLLSCRFFSSQFRNNSKFIATLHSIYKYSSALAPLCTDQGTFASADWLVTLHVSSKCLLNPRLNGGNVIWRQIFTADSYHEAPCGVFHTLKAHYLHPLSPPPKTQLVVMIPQSSDLQPRDVQQSSCEPLQLCLGFGWCGGVNTNQRVYPLLHDDTNRHHMMQTKFAVCGLMCMLLLC